MRFNLRDFATVDELLSEVEGEHQFMLVNMFAFEEGFDVLGKISLEFDKFDTACRKANTSLEEQQIEFQIGEGQSAVVVCTPNTINGRGTEICSFKFNFEKDQDVSRQFLVGLKAKNCKAKVSFK